MCLARLAPVWAAASFAEFEITIFPCELRLRMPFGLRLAAHFSEKSELTPDSNDFPSRFQFLIVVGTVTYFLDFAFQSGS